MRKQDAQKYLVHLLQHHCQVFGSDQETWEYVEEIAANILMVLDEELEQRMNVIEMIKRSHYSEEYSSWLVEKLALDNGLMDLATELLTHQKVLPELKRARGDSDSISRLVSMILCIPGDLVSVKEGVGFIDVDDDARTTLGGEWNTLGKTTYLLSEQAEFSVCILRINIGPLEEYELVRLIESTWISYVAGKYCGSERLMRFLSYVTPTSRRIKVCICAHSQKADPYWELGKGELGKSTVLYLIHSDSE